MAKTDTVAVSPPISVGELARAAQLETTILIGELMKDGRMAGAGDLLDLETAVRLGAKLGFAVEETARPVAAKPGGVQPSVLAPGEGGLRPPVIAVMGHVDHGKTTLLDRLRNANVAAGEAGGITQHVGAYQIDQAGRQLTLLDTPGHEAFAALRAHGAHLTDIALIVVAADDGLQPQTEQAIGFAREQGALIVVAVNKIDRPGADPARVRQQLAEHGLNPEEWGGETVVVDISAKTGEGVEQLVEMLLLVADVADLRARPDGPAEGTVIEAQVAAGRGSMARVLIRHGKLRVRDFVVAGHTWGKVRSLHDSNGQPVTQAGPSCPVAISGWKTTPALGDFMYAVKDEKAAKAAVAAMTRSGVPAEASGPATAEALSAAMSAGQTLFVPIVLKADVDGSLGALRDAIGLLGSDDIRVAIVASGLGEVNESDAARAAATGARIIGFNVPAAARIRQLAARDGVEVHCYSVIYELLDELREHLNKLLLPETIEEQAGVLVVKGVFKTSPRALICGGQVAEGSVRAGQLVRRADGTGIGRITAVQMGQQTVNQAESGELCGLSIATRSKVKLNVDDKLEFFVREERERTV